MDQTDFDELLRIQRMMASRIVEEADTDSKLKLYETIRDMIPDGKRRITREQVLIEARIQGMVDSETMRLIEQLKSDGYLREPEHGYLELT